MQKLRLEYLVDAKVGGAARVARLLRRPERLLSTVLLGNTFVNTAATALATTLAINIWPNHGVLISTVGLTIILLIFCETTPKTFAALHTERLALTFGRPLEMVAWLFTPFVVVLSWIASRFSKLVGVKPVPGSLVSDDEIRTMISLGQRQGEMEDAEAELLDKVFEFGDRPVREVMVPRPEVVAIEQGSKITEFLDLYAEHPLSRFPVYDENMDSVVGILAIKDVLMAQAKGGASKQDTIDDLVRPAHFTPETNRINELFSELRDHNYRMAVVVDEYGGTAGIVSLTRLVEEIVGPVGDELALVEKDYEIINANTFQVDGGMRIEEANEELELEFPEGDYETVAGFILYLLGRIPRANEQLRYKDVKIVITEMRGMKVEKILITKEGHGRTNS